MDYRFYLDALEIEEPIGWDDFELSMNRDDTYHGMQFEVSTGALQFHGASANYLKLQKQTNGISSNVAFTAQSRCDETFETIVTGRLNFGKYKDTCSVNGCRVLIPFEEDSCKVIFKNRFDQKVDLDNRIAFDKTTVLPDYAQLGQVITIPPKALQAAVDGSVADEGFVFNTEITGTAGLSFVTIYLRPDYATERYNNIATGQLTAVNTCVTSNPIITDGCDGPLTPQLLFEDDLTCFDGTFSYSSRMKGEVNVTGTNGLFRLSHIIFKWDGVGDIFADGDIVAQSDIFDYTADLPNDLPDAPFTFPFDDIITGTTTIPDGMGFYAIIALRSIDFTHSIQIDFDPETTVDIEAIKICPATTAQYYMMHEALSRVSESITNLCIRVKSDYYGRIDSQPFAFDDDGCGSLRMFTSGLKLRNAPDGKFFASAKDLIAGLNAIDNIGFDILPDTTIPGKNILRIEPVKEFYLDQQILLLEDVSNVTNEVQEGAHYANIKVGYEKWEVEKINGLNEFNSNREYRTNLETINTTLDIKSKLVAGSYPIELTRQQSFALTGASDTSYDNETFIICLERTAYTFIVEQGKILNPQNIFDPATVFNYRLSPLRNLMRWFKSIVNSYANIMSSSSKLFFNAGTGNFIASGNLDDNTACKIENTLPVSENMDLGVSSFANSVDYTPLWENETAAFEYPLSVAQYNALKANPYGYIGYTCAGGTEVNKGFIKEIKFRPARGMANFTLKKKWGT